MQMLINMDDTCQCNSECGPDELEECVGCCGKVVCPDCWFKCYVCDTCPLCLDCAVHHDEYCNA